jgi:hypothetical protein
MKRIAQRGAWIPLCGSDRLPGWGGLATVGWHNVLLRTAIQILSRFFSGSLLRSDSVFFIYSRLICCLAGARLPFGTCCNTRCCSLSTDLTANHAFSIRTAVWKKVHYTLV